MAQEYRDLNHQYYHHYFQYPERSQWMEQLWKEAFGDAYPEGLEHYGYVTRHDLDSFAKHLSLGPGSSVLDIGCGKGGPGLRLAERADWQLTGVDIIPEAIDQALAFSQQFDLKHASDFKVGDFYELPLEDASMDGVISIDAFWTATDKLRALLEVKRVMKPGARFVFTHWDILGYEQLPIFEESGLRLISREETPNWKEYQRKVYEGIEKYKNELILEMRESVNMLLYEAAVSPTYLDQSKRMIYVMER